MDAVLFTIIGFAVWRASSLLVNEDGPFDIFFHIRRFFGAEPDKDGIIMPNNVVGKALLCIWCTSIWVALPFALRYGLPDPFVFVGYWLAFSGLAIFAEHVMKVLKKWQCDTC